MRLVDYAILAAFCAILAFGHIALSALAFCGLFVALLLGRLAIGEKVNT